MGVGDSREYRYTLKGALRAGRWDVTYMVVPMPGPGLWRFAIQHRPRAGGQSTLAEFEWRPMTHPPDAGFDDETLEATLDLPALASAAGDAVVLQVLWETGPSAEATVIEAFPSMEIPGYVQ